MDYGLFLKTKRKELDFSTRALGNKVGVSGSYISMIENQKLSNPPSEEILEKICIALKFSESEKEVFYNSIDKEILPHRIQKKILRLEQKLQDCESKLAITHNGVGQIVVGNNNQIGSSKVLPDEFDLGELSEERMEELRRFIKYLKNS